MIGLFVTAMAIPHAYGSDRVVFACGYLVVVVVHAGMYVSEAARITRGMVVQLLGWNMLGAVLGLVGALFFEDILVWWWLASFVVAVVLPRLFSVTALNQPEDDGGPSFELVPGTLRGAARADAADRARRVGAGDRGRPRHRRWSRSASSRSRSPRSACCWRRRCTGPTSGSARTPAPRPPSTRCRPSGPRPPASRRTAMRSGSSSSGSCSAPPACTTPSCTRRSGSAGSTPASCAWAWACSGWDSACSGSPSASRRAAAPGRRGGAGRGHRGGCHGVRAARAALPAARVGGWSCCSNSVRKRRLRRPLEPATGAHATKGITS